MSSPKFPILLALGVTACTTGITPAVERPVPIVEAGETGFEGGVSTNWRTVATPDDRERLDQVDEVWAPALAQARQRGFRDEIRAEGPLLIPTGALLRPAPSPGSYRCRMIKIGGSAGFRVFPSYFCYVEAEGPLLILDKQTGSDRPAGWVWSDDDRQLVFLGALKLGSEDAPPAYGVRPDRDMAGVVQRVGPFRWRLVMPARRPGASLDVLELVPAPLAIPIASAPN